MMSRWVWLLIGALLVGCAAPTVVPTPAAVPTGAPVQQVRIAAPENLEPLLRALAAAYQRENPTVEISVIKRADALAWEALHDGEVDLVGVTWTPEDLPPEIWLKPLARDGVAVVVNPQNGIPGLTLEQARLLFQGRAEDWAPWGGLPGAPQVVTREDASGDTLLFQRQVMGDFPMALTALLAPTSEVLLDVVSTESLAVGYVSTSRLSERVRALALEGVPPVPEMLAAGLYPLTRDCVLAASGEPQAAAGEFVRWLEGERASAIIQQQGFLLPPAS
ncbi:MAG TPA: substrate-binding domain-containing protein [Anaerolineae bacterium]|nr:substrate-binding domain-containing protein [Anaerolineae bacterium]HQM15533.1 substrate-binding domain-containing protein [Anaerolineae bacterium]